MTARPATLERSDARPRAESEATRGLVRLGSQRRERREPIQPAKLPRPAETLAA